MPHCRLKAHRIRLVPNKVQATYFAKAAGVARFSYNWALDQWTKEYKAGCKPTQGALRKKLNAIKANEYPWMLEVTKNAPQMAIIQLGAAFSNYFAKRAKYPTFKKKGVKDRFSLSNDQFRVEGKHIHIPRLGRVRMREALRFEGKVNSAVVSRRADGWYVSIAVEVQEQPEQETKSIGNGSCHCHGHQPSNDCLLHENQVLKGKHDNKEDDDEGSNSQLQTLLRGAEGVDLGICSLATLSCGKRVPGPKPHRAKAMRLVRLSKSLSRKQKGSKNREKAKLKLARLHLQISNIRQDCLHKLTTSLAKKYALIGIESLHVKGMMANGNLARSIQDMGFYEFRRQLEYKMAWRDGGSSSRLVVADRWFASSKLCSNCGYKLKTLGLNERQWRCPACATTHDRDVNAAINLKHYAVSSTVNKACGEGSAGYSKRCKTLAKTKLPSMKQESNRKIAMHD